MASTAIRSLNGIFSISISPVSLFLWSGEAVKSSARDAWHRASNYLAGNCAIPNFSTTKMTLSTCKSKCLPFQMALTQPSVQVVEKWVVHVPLQYIRAWRTLASQVRGPWHLVPADTGQSCMKFTTSRSGVMTASYQSHATKQQFLFWHRVLWGFALASSSRASYCSLAVTGCANATIPCLSFSDSPQQCTS